MKNKIIFTLAILPLFQFLASCCGGKECAKIDAKVDSVEFFLVNVEVARHFSVGAWNTRQHVFVKVNSGENSGWGEAIVSVNNPDFNLGEFAKRWEFILNSPLDEAINGVNAAQFNAKESYKWKELFSMAFWDLKGRQVRIPTVRLLGLDEKKSVDGMFCILENTEEGVREKARIAKSQNLTRHVKMKLFGDNELDCRLARVLREEMGQSCKIIADVNGGYSQSKTLLSDMRNLKKAGIDVCEDPIHKITYSEWINFHKECKKFGLELIVDRDIRHASSSHDKVVENMADYYNIHPGCQGDFYFISLLINRIQSFGGKIMVGDDSLVGPAAPVYQQIAIACGAEWVEALEKPQESTVFQDCLISKPTFIDAKNRYQMRENFCGWGVEIDVSKLKEKSINYKKISAP